MACQSQGAYSKLAIAGQQVEFLTFEDNGVIELVDNEEAIRGFLDHPKERVTQGLKKWQFTITMQPSPTEMDLIFPYIGFTESPTDTFTVTDDFSALEFDVIVDKVAKVQTYADCKVDKAIFQGQKGRKPNQLTLMCIAKSMTQDDAGTFSASAIDTDFAYAFTEGVLTLQSSARAFDRYAVIIDNHLNAEFNNSQEATCIQPAERTIHLAVNTPYTSSEIALFDTPFAGASGAAGTIAWTRGSKSTAFSFANLKSVAKPVSIPGKVEIRQPLFYKAYKSGSTAALIVTHDNT